MGLAGSAKVLAASAVWRLTGSSSAGRSLVDAASSDDADSSVLASTLLVRAGDRAVGLVADALADGSADPKLVDVLASINTDAARVRLETLKTATEGDVADEAEQALSYLDELDRYRE